MSQNSWTPRRQGFCCRSFGSISTPRIACARCLLRACEASMTRAFMAVRTLGAVFLVRHTQPLSWHVQNALPVLRIFHRRRSSSRFFWVSFLLFGCPHCSLFRFCACLPWMLDGRWLSHDQCACHLRPYGPLCRREIPGCRRNSFRCYTTYTSHGREQLIFREALEMMLAKLRSSVDVFLPRRSMV